MAGEPSNVCDRIETRNAKTAEKRCNVAEVWARVEMERETASDDLRSSDRCLVVTCIRTPRPHASWRRT